MANYNKDSASDLNPYHNIQDLNAISSEYNLGLASQDQVAADPFELDDSLAIFTNANFFDLETGEPADTMQQQQFDMSRATNISPSSAFIGSSNGAEFSPNDFNFGGFATDAFSNVHPENSTFAKPQISMTSASSTAHLTSKPGTTSSHNGGITSSIEQSPSMASNDPNHASSEADQQDTTDLNVSTEEDKRRRNTAASARFRVKKKQREQAMEKTAKDMSEKVTNLEDTISELRKENSLLKGLLTEKMGKSPEDKRRVRSESSDEPAEPRSKKRGKPALEASNEVKA